MSRLEMIISAIAIILGLLALYTLEPMISDRFILQNNEVKEIMR